MNLLSENDWKHLDAALRKMKSITLERELGPVKIRATTVPADNAWPAPMLIRIERWTPLWYETQYFESA